MSVIRYGVLLLLLLCNACASRGHVPSYILTDSPEAKQEVHKYQGDSKSGPSLIEGPK